MAVTELIKKAVSDDALALLHSIMLDPAFNDFYLVGGTALALQIGHKISVDIDLFTIESFNVQQISDASAMFTRQKKLKWKETLFEP